MNALKQLRRNWDKLGRDEIRRLQGAVLQRYLRTRVLPYSAFYRELFRRESINADRIRALDDLRHIPVVSKQTLVSSPEHPDRAREFVLIPDPAKLARRPSVMLRAALRGKQRVQDELTREFRPTFLTSTTGRSADPVPFLYTGHDLDNLTSSGYRLVDVLGAFPDDRIVNMFPYAPHLAFWQTHYATTAYNVFSVSTGGGKVMGTDGNIRVMAKINPNAIIGMPTFLYHVLTQAAEEGVRLTNLRSIILGGEKVPAGMRRKLRELAKSLGAGEVFVMATYGFTEARAAWGECPFPAEELPGGYHLYPDLGVFEVIDPETGALVDDGEPGELVFTPLDARGSVVLRYRTGDFIDGGLTYEPCPHCGRRMPRLVGQISRQSEVRELRLDKIKGTLVDFNELDHVLDDADHVGAWLMELRKVNDDPHELDELILHVEKLGSSDEQALSNELASRIAAHTELRPNEILFHNRREMRRLQGVGEELKEKRFVDHRPREGRPPPPRESAQRDGILKSIFKRRKGGG